MPKTLTIHELFGQQSPAADQPPVEAPAAQEQGGGLLSAEQLFGVQSEAPTPNAQPQSGGQRVPGVPYPVAPVDALGLPRDMPEVSGITRFAEELPGVLGDVAQATKGVIRDTLWEDMTDEERQAGKRLFDDLRETQATRAPLQGAMQFTKTLHGVINRPLALAGVEGADENASQADRIVTALGQENSRRAAEGLIAQAFGETAGEISESVISSLVEQYLGARLLGGAGKGATALDKAKRATRAAMLYTGVSAGNHALTEADDMGLTGAKRWGYAGSVGAINAAFIAAGGALAKKLGLEDVAQAMFSDTTPVITNVLAKSGVQKALTTLLKGLGGAGIEGTEELGTEFTAGLSKAAFDGDPEGALDRMIAKTQDREFLENVGMAGLTGAAARGAVGAAKNLGVALGKAKEMIPDALNQMVDVARSRKMIDQFNTELDQEGVTTEETPPAAPPEAPVAPERDQTLVTPPAEGAPVAAPQGAPLAPAPDAAEAAPPSVESVAGTPPAGPPVTPPGEPAAAPQIDSQAEPAVEALAAEPGGPSISPPPDPIKMANASMAELARSLGRGESYYSPGTRGLREAGELAVAANIPDRALGIATDVLENNRVLTSVEEVGLGLRVQKISAQLQQNRAQMASATDDATISSLAAEANILGAEFDTIRNALEQGGTDPARLLAYRRWAFPDDVTEESLVARIKTARKGPATDEDKTFAKTVSKQYADNVKKLDAARKVQNEAVAKEALAEMKKEGAPTEGIADINARIRELLDQGCNLE